MRQNSSIKPFTPSPATQIPHPVLQAALDNLDVRLEEELARYRRQRRLKPEPSAQSRVDQSRVDHSHRLLQQELAQQRSAQRELPQPTAGKFNSRGESSERLPEPKAGQINQVLEKPSEPEVGISRGSLDTEANLALASSALGASAAGVSSTFARQEILKSEREARSRSPQAVSVSAAQASIAKNVTEAKDFQTGELALSALDANSPGGGIASYAQQANFSAFEPDTALQKFVRQPDSKDSDDYLESSEELLRSIAEEEPELRAERQSHLLDTLLTPLGIGSMLLLLLSSATLAYVIMNPTSLGFLLAHSRASDAGDSSSIAKTSTNQGTVNLPTTPINSAPPSPDLSAEEFHDLNLNTLSTLPKNGTTGSSASAKPSPNSSVAIPETSSNLAVPSTSVPEISNRSSGTAETAVPSAPQVVVPQVATHQVRQTDPPSAVRSEAPAVAPKPAPAPAPSEPDRQAAASRAEAAPTVATAPATTNPAPSQSYYYVVADYSGDPSLKQARTAVPDAYVQNLPSAGAKIKLGAFSNEARAQEQIQELQQHGISARIYQP